MTANNDCEEGNREDDEDELRILHCFADYGTESEVLSKFGDVIRVGIDPNDTNESKPIKADAHIENKKWDLPIKEEEKEGKTFDLGLFHPVCSRWAATTSISGDPHEHENMIPSARKLANEYCNHYIIENVPRAPLHEPVVLNGRMFGMSIQYERAFETSFEVPQPPLREKQQPLTTDWTSDEVDTPPFLHFYQQYKDGWAFENPQPPRKKEFLTTDGPSEKAETSSFFFSERSKEWWGAVKNYSPGPYPKGHIAKNAIPAPFIYYLVRLWLMAYEDERGISEGRVDYSNYDERMDIERKSEDHRQLDEF